MWCFNLTLLSYTREVALSFIIWGIYFLKIRTHFFLEFSIFTNKSLDNILWECDDAISN